MEQKESLLGVIQTLFKWKKPILITTIAAAIGSGIVVLLIPVYYQASTIFYAASPDLAMPERIFGITKEAMEYYGEDEDIDRIMTIANSNELGDFLIQTFNLYEHYDIDPKKDKAPYYVQIKLKKLYKVQKTKFDAIQLSVEDQDKERAAAMANASRAKIDEIAQRMIKASQMEVLNAYDRNIKENQSILKELNDTLKLLRSTYGVFNTETQSEVLATLLDEAESNLNNYRAMLQIYQSTPNAPQDSITNLRAKIQGMEASSVGLRERLDRFNEGMAQVDVLVKQHLEASKQFAEGQERYKMIRTAFDSPFPAIHLVEEAAPPIIKSRPKRTLIVLAVTVLAFLFSVAGALIFDTYKDIDWKSITNAR